MINSLTIRNDNGCMHRIFFEISLIGVAFKYFLTEFYGDFSLIKTYKVNFTHTS
jgi:hypothetical protein